MMLSKALSFMMLIGMAVRAVADDSATIDDSFVENVTVSELIEGNSTIEFFNQVQDKNEDPTESIIGGVELTRAERNKRPYLVTVRHRNVDGTVSLCGGSVISPSAVLTAAHCLFDKVTGLVAQPMWVELYRWALSDTSGFVTIPIAPGNAVPHQDYNVGIHLNNDVAILFLGTPVSIKPVILNTDQNIPGSSGVPLDVAGWGEIDNDEHSGDILKATTIGYVPTLDCTNPPYNWPANDITDSMMCAIGDGTTAHCHGDSGGPLVLGKGGSKGGPISPVVQVGVVSHHHTNSDCLSTFPSVYARVSDVWGWISKTVCQRTGELCQTPVASKSSKRHLRN